MRKRFLFLGLLLILLAGACGCSSQSKTDSQSALKEEELLTVVNNICLKTGTSFDGNTVLESKDFVGFSYQYNESQKQYLFTFQLTEEGQKKMADVTTKMAKTSGDLSLWIGDECITSAKVMEPITGDSFAVTMVDLNEDSVSDLVNKLEGKQG